MTSTPPGPGTRRAPELPGPARRLLHRLYQRLWPLRGSQRLVSLLGRRAPRAELIEVRLWTGARLTLPWEPAGLAPSLWRTGSYEELQSLLTLRLCRQRVFYDVGANVGYYSALAAGAGAREVVAFEPFPRNLELLGPNVSRDPGWRVRIVETAAGSKRSRADLHDGGAFGIGSVSLTRAVSDRTVAVVEVAPIDELIAERGLPEPDLAKFDIEGFEAQALAGFEQTLRSCQPILLLELNEPLLRAAGASSHEMIALLSRLGYDGLLDIGGRRPEPLVEGRTLALLAFTPRRAAEVMAALPRQ